MANSKSKSAWRWLAFGGGLTVMMFLAVGISTILESTIINPWVLFGVIVAVGAVTGTVLHRPWGRLTGTGKFYVNYPLHVFVFTIVMGALLLMVNFFATDFDRLPSQRVIIENRLAKTRYHTKRVTRRTYTRGAPYKVYYLEVSLPGGEHREVYVKKSLYDKARKGDTATVKIGRGALSFEVFDPASLTLLHPRVNKKSASRCKFFGTSGKRHTPPEPPLSRVAREKRFQREQQQQTAE